jgi:hypothetical protein
MALDPVGFSDDLNFAEYYKPLISIINSTDIGDIRLGMGLLMTMNLKDISFKESHNFLLYLKNMLSEFRIKRSHTPLYQHYPFSYFHLLYTNEVFHKAPIDIKIKVIAGLVMIICDKYL